MLQAYETPMVAVDNVDMPLGEALLDVLTSNTQIIDALSFRSPEITSSSAGKDTSTPGYYVGTGSERIFRSAFQMKSGMTTLTIEGWAQKGASESFQLFVDGVLAQTLAVPNGASFTLTASISSKTAESIVEVSVQISGTGYGGSGVVTKYIIKDAYVSPVSVGAVWSGVPTFASTYSATLINQLANAQSYLAQRLNAIPYMPYLAQYYAHGSSVSGDTYPLAYGAVERANGTDTLNIRIIYMNMGNIAEFYRVRVGSTGGVGGTTLHTSSTYGVADVEDDQYLALPLTSFSTGTRLEFVIETVVTTGPAAGPSGDRNSRYHIWTVRESNSAPSTISAPYDFTADESVAHGTLNTRLNALSTALSAVKSRIDANPRIFDRVPLMRRMYGRDNGQYSVYSAANTYVQRFVRRGARLVVKGKNVKIGWGGISTKAEKTTTTAYSVDFSHSQQIIDGDEYQTKVIYLDTLPDLRRSMSYSVYGEDVTFAAEYLI